MALIVQKLKREFSSDIQKAIRYYSVLSVIGNVKLTNKQIELLAFISVRGSIKYSHAREEFVTMFDSSLASLENIKSRLVRMGWLVEIDKKYKINPKIQLDFTKDIILQINLETKVQEDAKDQ